MKSKYFVIFVFDKNNSDVTVLGRSTRSEFEAEQIMSFLEALRFDAVSGIRPVRFVNGKCVYDED